MNSRYIINADDFGLSDNVNEGIDFCFKQNIISSATMLANGICFENAVDLAKKGGYIEKIGLHFNIIEGKALSDEMRNCKTFCNERGDFIYKRNSIRFFSKKEILALKSEVEAQVKKCLCNGIPISHIDSHTHVHTEFLIMLAIKPVLKKYGIKKVRKARKIIGGCLIRELYKSFFNYMLKCFGFKTTDVFYGYNDYEYFRKFYNYETVEMYVHPTLIGGVLLDHVLNVEIIKQNIKHISYKDL